jgi:hypothetical protein
MNIFNLASLDKEYPPKVAQLWIYVVILYELFVLKILHELAWSRIVLPTIWAAYADGPTGSDATTLLTNCVGYWSGWRIRRKWRGEVHDAADIDYQWDSTPTTICPKDNNVILHTIAGSSNVDRITIVIYQFPLSCLAGFLPGCLVSRC